MKNKHFNALLSCLLAVVMIAGLFPAFTLTASAVQQAIPEAIEEVIPKMPGACQAEARESVQRLKANPDALLAALDEITEADEPDADEPIDYDSAEYKSFAATCAGLKAYFEENQELIAATYKEEFAKKGITLIVT